MRVLPLAVMTLFMAAPALPGEPTAEALLARYDAVMGPPAFESESEMTAYREDGTSRTYVMKMLRGEEDRFRVWFKDPASARGQEMLRSGDNMWVYLPSLKRATRIANRDSFQGGDFNNADVMRVNYTKDYACTRVPSNVPGTYALELKARTPETAYDAIKLWVRKSDGMPVRGEYYGTSGQMLRSAEFTGYTEFEKGYTRPARVVMRNELVKSRRSELVIHSMHLRVEAPPQRFTQVDLGR
ncbi:outer membrane lipoprotein-sorting protein [Melittangium boletus]|uniref:Uncharacterized protein TP-0789 domain-containing protein n=1 Tax=Melittangium boletus DSM 14713 TaxID=1294270 RepID=A0A250IJS8_9BACT|nr:outer membrane lipoprotein-sorting protein [Melittangium boletus]ATB31186.1 hypothetical protein MEBOL_004648 [Melittangium boletus DSM 14713]